jgi:AcrR family transcriptional regulator
MPKPLPRHILDVTAGDPGAARTFLLQAAHRVIAAQGLSAASTRNIAAEAGIAAGTLYNYFDDRLDLVSSAILLRAHMLAQPIGSLPERAGSHTVRRNLSWFASQAEVVLAEIVPLIAAAFGEPELLAALRRRMAADDPASIAVERVSAYLQAERQLGRIDADADCRGAAKTIVSLCHDRAFQRYLRGDGPTDPPTRELTFIASAIGA